MRFFPEEPAAGTNWSEKQLFTALSGENGKSDWVVFHSLTIGQNIAAYTGEADFVVLVPGKGIVVIEAKAPTSATYRRGKWNLEGTPKPTKDPLKQLNVATGSIKKFLSDRDIYDNLPICRLLWFTSLSRHHLDVKHASDITFFEWELAWREDMANPAKYIEKVLDEYIAFHTNAEDSLGLKPEVLDLERVNEISDSLLTTFSVSQSAQDRFADRAKIERDLLAAQLSYLDIVEDNKHIYFDGPAGTGKTVLLAEAARRSARAGMNTVVTCWNVMMAEELAKQCGGRVSVEVADLNSLMLRIAGLTQNPKDADGDWYQVKLPQKAIDALNKRPLLAAFDTIIVDEFQDISAHNKVLEFVFTLSRHGKLNRTRMIFAGDAKQQIMLDGGSRNDPYAILKDLISDFVLIRLKVNCRMAPKLAAEIDDRFDFGLSKLEHRLSKTKESSLNVVESKPGQEAKELLAAIKKLLETYQPEDIRILSPFGPKHSLAGELFTRESKSAAERELKTLLRHESSKGKIKWRSIAKYKGLDSGAVIITDINAKAKEFAQSTGKTLRDLLYVGATRAKYDLVIITSDKVIN